jgi:hypothetical protein
MVETALEAYIVCCLVSTVLFLVFGWTRGREVASTSKSLMGSSMRV